MDILSLLEVAQWVGKRIRPRKVLLAVEDNSEDALLLQEELKIAKFGYVITRSAEEALGVLRSRKFDAALIDMGLPMMNGVDLASKIRDNYPKTRVFFITGSSFINLEESTLFRVIRKPITANVLREMVI